MHRWCYLPYISLYSYLLHELRSTSRCFAMRIKKPLKNQINRF